MEKREKRLWCLKGAAAGVLLCIFLVPVLAFLERGLWENGGFTLRWYREVFLSSPLYLKKFWASLGLTLVLTAGQMAVGIMAAYGLVIYEMPGRRVAAGILLILLLLPVQVLLVPQYLVLERFKLLDTMWALILPYFFLPFSTYFLMLFFEKTDRNVLDAARLEGAGSVKLLTGILLPMERRPVAALGLLVFLYAWSMVEQPMAFLKDPQLYPLAVYLMTAPEREWGLLSPCGVLAVLPLLAVVGAGMRKRTYAG